MDNKISITQLSKWIVWMEIVKLFKEKPKDSVIRAMENTIERIIREERSRAADLLIEHEGCDIRWIAEQIRRDF